VAFVNVQATPVDPKAALVAHARVDEVMGRAMALLRIPVPCYCRIAPLLVTHDVQAALPATAGGRGTGATSSEAGATTTLVIELRSAHGADCPLPWLSTCSITFAHTPDASPHLLHSPCRRLELPLPSDWLPEDGECVAELALTLAPGTTEQPPPLRYHLSLHGVGGRRAESRRYDVVTTRSEYGACTPDDAADTEPLAPTRGVSSASSASTQLVARADGALPSTRNSPCAPASRVEGTAGTGDGKRPRLS